MEWPSIEPGPSQTEAMAMPNMQIEINNADAVLKVRLVDLDFLGQIAEFCLLLSTLVGIL
jgi:hypothetical protein